MTARSTTMVLVHHGCGSCSLAHAVCQAMCECCGAWGPLFGHASAFPDCSDQSTEWTVSGTNRSRPPKTNKGDKDQQNAVLLPGSC